MRLRVARRRGQPELVGVPLWSMVWVQMRSFQDIVEHFSWSLRMDAKDLKDPLHNEGMIAK